MKSRIVFKDKDWDAKLKSEGYVIIPLLNSETIAGLIDLFYAIPQHNSAFATFAIEDYSIRTLVDASIKAVVSNFCKLHFIGYHPYWGNFFIKNPGSPAIPLHADLQYAEEPEVLSYNIWCPLQAVDAHNGGLGIVPRSHKACTQIRGTNITNSYRKNNESIQNQLGVSLSLKPGEAVVYDHRLLHYSPPNLSDQARIAITCVITQKNADVIHYYADNEDSTNFEKYIIPDVEVFLRTPFNQKPYGILPSGYIKGYSFKPLTVNDISPAYTVVGSRIKALFNFGKNKKG